MAFEKIVFYSISDPRTESVFYVGQTKNFEIRKYQHLRKSSNKKVREIVSEILISGMQPIFEILEYSTDGRYVDIEKKWINHYKNLGFKLCNINDYPLLSSEITSFGAQISKNTLMQFKELCKRHNCTQSAMITQIINDTVQKEKIWKLPK